LNRLCQGAAVSKPPTAICMIAVTSETAGGNALPYNLLAKPRIEVETAGIFNFDFAEIVMFRIKEKRSLSRHNHTRNGENRGVT
jgi:hypothetical protein